jgi:glycyl-tRNA synthetase
MDDLLQKVISLTKRKGFIFPSSEIYGGFASSYDFGPLGVELENNIKKLWWDEMTKLHEGIVGLDASILMSPKVWQASGHLTAGFADELIECKKCHLRFRKDEIPADKNNEFWNCSTGGKHDFLKARNFNLMMKTFVGPVENEAAETYLRAETCQGIYVNFENVMKSMRLKVPFGIAQIGKSFRNEINPKDFLYRVREFEQMEMQWFCNPKDAEKFFDFWKNERLKWLLSLGIKKENLRLVEIPKKERSHYARQQIDIEYKFPFGWKEIEGIHNRGDWDLSNHSRYSGEDLKYFDEENNERYFPYIIETSVGVGRSFFAFLCDAYEEVKGGRTKTTESAKETETVLKLNKKIAPIKVAILPLLKNKPQLVKKAKEIFAQIKPQFVAQYDEIGTIGRRYRRQDEIGTPYCVTVDFQTLEDSTVTLRNRDTMKQDRVKQDDLVGWLDEQIKA